jgi:hypothetical protein
MDHAAQRPDIERNSGARRWGSGAAALLDRSPSSHEHVKVETGRIDVGAVECEGLCVSEHRSSLRTATTMHITGVSV